MSFAEHNTTAAGEVRPARHTFTVDEANRSLVLVKRIVADVVSEYEQLVDLQETMDVAEATGADQQWEEAHLELIRTAGRLRSCLAELDDIGVELRDWSLGMLDFPCVAGGRQVYLCWQYGDEKVGYWHELDADFAARRPIETLPKGGGHVMRGGRYRGVKGGAKAKP